MTPVQKIILIAFLVVGGLCLIVGFSLMHHIGGFLRTVEEEREQEQFEPPPEQDTPDDAPSQGQNT